MAEAVREKPKTKKKTKKTTPVNDELHRNGVPTTSEGCTLPSFTDNIPGKEKLSEDVITPDPVCVENPDEEHQILKVTEDESVCDQGLVAEGIIGLCIADEHDKQHDSPAVTESEQCLDPDTPNVTGDDEPAVETEACLAVAEESTGDAMTSSSAVEPTGLVMPLQLNIPPVESDIRRHITAEESAVSALGATREEPVETVGVPTIPPDDDVVVPSAPTHMYPSLPVEQPVSLLPLTPEQLHTLYYNPQLQRKDAFVEQFLQVVNQDKHEFYELILNYYRARNCLASAEHDIQVLRDNYQRYCDLVWELKEEKMSVQGQCQDKCKVSEEITFTVAFRSESACEDVSRTLNDIRKNLHEQLSLQAYQAQLSRLQVESYLHKLYESNPALKNLPQNSPAVADMWNTRSREITRQVEVLKSCINVLFMFQRKPAKDDIFIQDSRQWLSRLVATLLRLATLEDHSYLVNQLVRCPAGVGKWGAHFVQVVAPPSCWGSSSWGSPLLDHILVLLAYLLQPVKSREALLYQMKVSMTPSPDKANENPWILVDSDGEEDEDPLNSWYYMQENDLVRMLNQIPLDYIFRHVLFMEKDDRDNELYDVRLTSENNLLRLFAFSSCVIQVLGEGLKNLSLGRYRQLNKRLGKMIRHVVCFVADHWENFQTGYPHISMDTKDRLQLEYDMVVERAVLCILRAQRLGSWQFLVDLPYSGVSLSTMWRLLWLMHHGCHVDKMVQSQDLDLSLDDCKASLRDCDNRTWFEEKLVSMPTSEAIFLLTTFANMAQSRPVAQHEFIQAVASEIYEIAYIKEHTRKLCSKQGRELLTAIAMIHPFVLTDLLLTTQHTLHEIGKVCLYLYKELPLYLWKPTEEDLSILSNWLVRKDLGTVENQLAQMILEGLNWGYNQQADAIFLNISLHYDMAVLLVESYMTHLSGKYIGGLVTDGLKQMASLVRNQETLDQQLANWTWRLAQRLCLHLDMQPRRVLGSPDSAGLLSVDTVPVLEDCPSLQPILTGINKDFAVAAYLAIVMSNYGHSVGEFCSTGVKLLGALVAKQHFIPTIRVLSHVGPLFYNVAHYLLFNDLFYQVLQVVMQADNSKKGYFSTQFPGPVTKLFCGMIQFQVQVASLPGGVGGNTVVLFWLQILTKMQNWSQDKNVLYVVDKLLQVAFRIPNATDCVQQFFASLVEEQTKKERGATVLSSLASWLGSSNKGPGSLVEGSLASQFPWYAFTVLSQEAATEEHTRLWTSLQRKLVLSPDATVDGALAEVAAELSLQQSACSQRLPIYRWAELAINMDMEHPALPLAWQRFFVLYLARLDADPGLPQRGSIGEKFFDSGSSLSQMKKMKKRLTDTADHFQELATRSRGGRDQLEGSQSDGEDASGHSDSRGSPLLDPSGQRERREFYHRLVRFYTTLSYWLDEPRLHDSRLYLPALPPQYDAPRLLSVFQNQTAPWLSEVDTRRVDEELRQLAKSWTALTPCRAHQGGVSGMQTGQDPRTATERILARLQRQCKPLPPPPLSIPQRPVPELSTQLLCDQQNLFFALRADFCSLVEFAKVYCLRVSRHVGLDCYYNELLPQLYTNETNESAVSAQCRSLINPTHKCKGPAIITCRYDAATRNEIVNRKLEENRAEFKQLVIECLLPPPQNVCSAAVHAENAISDLINLVKSTKSPSTRQRALDVGTALFYNVTTFISEDTKYYPPTCQFFSSVVEILGQEFIRNNPTQSQALLQAVLQNPGLVGLLTPNFSPNASPDLLVNMYEDMVPVPFHQGPDVAFTLLTKFDVQRWLNAKPPLSQREALLDVLATALVQCGQKPHDKIKSVFQIHRHNLKLVMAFQFPDHYGTVLKLVLKGSCNQELCPEVWTDILRQLGCEQTTHDDNEPIDVASAVTEGNPPLPVLPPQQVRETLDYLGTYFFRQRVSDSEAAKFGLYPKWKTYTLLLAKLVGFLSNEHVAMEATRVSTGAGNAEQVVHEVWEQLKSVFAPWIQPLDNNGEILSPWIPNDVSIATEMLSGWCEAVRSLQLRFEGLLPVCSQAALTLLWPYYAHTIARASTPKHIVQAFSEQMASLPWEKLYPDVAAVQLMVQVYTGDYQVSSRDFVAKMFSRIPWGRVVQGYGCTELPEITARLHVCLLTLVVALGKEPANLQNPSFLDLIRDAESFNWNLLDALSYEQIVTEYLAKCDPKCVLAERTADVRMVLSLLKSAAGFIRVPNDAFHPETPLKRCMFVRCVVQLICKCSHLKEIKAESFHVILANLLTEVESVVGSIVDVQSQQHQAVSLCVEVLSVLNHCNTQGASSKVLNQTLLEWVAASCSSILLLPLLTAAGRGLASLSDMVVMEEACMEAHFLNDASGLDATGWAPLLAMLQMPEMSLESYLEEGVRQGCYLALYGYILQRLPLSRSLDDELQCLQTLVDWTAKAKPGPQNEAKLLLWWGKMMELILRQLQYGGRQGAVLACMKRLVPALVSLGEDKSSTGLLGAVGLGKKSQLSFRFRVMCKAVATFLSAQVPTDTLLRLEPNSPGSPPDPAKPPTPRRSSASSTSSSAVTNGDVPPSQHAVQALGHVDSLRTNKQYLLYKEHLDFIVEFTSTSAHTLYDAPTLLLKLVSNLFPDYNYLAPLRVSGD